jgi:hypothetical protein
MAAPAIETLIRTYFPEGEWEHADCILRHECPPTTEAYPAGCVREIGNYRCNGVEGLARAWGAFGLLDVCWSPEVQSDSPFTPEQWARVLDPNYNVWMASRIWSLYGWSVWTTFNQCGIQSVEPGGTIPHPEGPLANLSDWLLPRDGGGFDSTTLVVGIVAVAAGAALYAAESARR